MIVTGTLASLIFPDGGDADFNKRYPTIYHLRNALIHEHKQFDLRAIYLAMHHIVKYRGNFLDTTPVDQFKTDNIPFSEYLTTLNQDFKEIIDDLDNEVIKVSNANQIKDELLSTDIKNFDKQKSVAKLLDVKQGNKGVNKTTTDIMKEISKALLGNKVKLNILLHLPVDPKDKDRVKELTVQFSDENIDDELLNVLPELDDARQSILDTVRNWYAQVTLNQIIPNGMGLSESMVQKYDAHRKHLEIFKSIVDNVNDRKQKHKLENAYSAYVHNQPGIKRMNRDEFYSAIKNNLGDSDAADYILDLIEKDQFMPKQRTADNGVIPHQLHQLELKQIIDNQKEFHPFLAELNPNSDRSHLAQYKLEELAAFHIPYYVGPLITKDQQEKESNKDFAWMVRKESGQITPWNFDQKVDRVQSADAFIKRMTTKDSYLLGEDVLPDESILYQRFKVLNELNMVKINGHRISVAQKQQIFNDLFTKQKTVSVKRLQNYLNLPTVEITGLSDPKKFNNSLSTYIDFKGIFGDQVDSPDLQSDFEKMTEWSTIFESRDIYRTKLSEISWLTEEQINKLVNKRYRGWGRLSKKLLVGLKDANGERIIDALWNTNRNFMQIQSQPDFAEQIVAENSDKVKADGMEAILDEAYTSPQNKKAVRQVIGVVEDIKKAMHDVEPASISIEFTRAPKDKRELTKSRKNQISSAYHKIAKEIANGNLNDELETHAKSKQGLTDKLYLYFTQLGRDMYTGDPINIDQLYNYDIDHILPQSFIKDDSLNNRVLVSRAVNNQKSDNIPNDLFGSKMGSFWRQLQADGLISKAKLRNLTMDPSSVDKYAMKGFINRQLVETSQVIKLVATILGNEYHDSKIIEVTAKMNHQIREQSKFIKNRFINDYHHAFDAYLTVFAGTYLYQRYPKLQPYFVYGQNKFVDDNKTQLKRFNFLHDLYQSDLTKIDDKDYYPVVAKYQHLLQNQAPKIYNYKFMLITHEVTMETGAMFNQTIYPARDASRRKLIPIKQGKPVEQYGGYSGSVDAYMAIVRIHDKKGDQYRVAGVKRRWADELNQYYKNDRAKYMQLLHDKLAPEFTKKGKVQDFEVILGHVLGRQAIIDGDDKFTLGSSTYKYNNRQLVLSKRVVDTLDTAFMNQQIINVNDFEKDLSECYDEAYQEIVEKVDKYMPLYDKNGFRQGLKNGYDAFSKLPNRNKFNGNKKISSGKLEIIQEILNGLHANPTFGNLKEIGIKTPFGMMQDARGVKLSPEAIICYQSPTGLFERKIRLKDL
ncbi:type II CRISPR RNA-guided endonuclease Cas9 [Lactobacillaceae bacterium Melli_B3]